MYQSTPITPVQIEKSPWLTAVVTTSAARIMPLILGARDVRRSGLSDSFATTAAIRRARVSAALAPSTLVTCAFWWLGASLSNASRSPAVGQRCGEVVREPRPCAARCPASAPTVIGSPPLQSGRRSLVGAERDQVPAAHRGDGAAIRVPVHGHVHGRPLSAAELLQRPPAAPSIPVLLPDEEQGRLESHGTECRTGCRIPTSTGHTAAASGRRRVATRGRSRKPPGRARPRT